MERTVLLKLRFSRRRAYSTYSTCEHEGFYTIEGQITFNVDGQRIEAKPGTFVNIPPNVLHSFKIETSEIAKLIIVLSPA